MVTNNQKLVFCIEETQEMFNFIEKETNWDWMDVSIEMAHLLGNPNYESLIVKLGSAPGSVELDTSSFENWNKQLEEEIELEPTTELELDLLYQAICKFKEKQNSNFEDSIKDLTPEFQAIIKDSLKYGRIIRSDEEYILK